MLLFNNHNRNKMNTYVNWASITYGPHVRLCTLTISSTHSIPVWGRSCRDPSLKDKYLRLQEVQEFAPDQTDVVRDQTQTESQGNCLSPEGWGSGFVLGHAVFITHVEAANLGPIMRLGATKLLEQHILLEGDKAN